MDIRRDVTFDEDSAYNKSRKRPVEDSEETDVPRIQNTTMNDTNQDEDREIEEPQEPIDPPQENNPHRRKAAWVREAIQGVERYGALEEMHSVSWNISPPADSKVFHWSEWFRSRTNRGQRLKTLPRRCKYLEYKALTVHLCICKKYQTKRIKATII